MRSLYLKAFGGLAVLFLIMASLLFVAAGTLHYWQGWLFLAIYFLASLAITLYLAKKYAHGALYPAALEDEARLWQWSFWAVAEVDRGVNIWSLHAVRLPPNERDAALRNEALGVLAAPFAVLDAAVSKNPYLLGPEFTVADLNVAAVLSRAVDMDLSAWPHLKNWLVRCLERPAARRALALKTKSDQETPAETTRRIARINRL